MSADGVFSLLAAAGVIIAVAYTLKRLGAPSRPAVLEETARALGLRFTEDVPPGLRLPGLPLFAFGEDENLPHNFLDAGAHAGARLFFFDFYYRTGVGKYKETGYLTVALAVIDSPRLPELQLQPERLSDKIAQALTGDDVDLPDYPEFSNKYQLCSASPELASAFFYHYERARVMETRPGWYLQAGRDALLLSRHGSGRNLVSAENYPAFIEEVKALLTELKP